MYFFIKYLDAIFRRVNCGIFFLIGFFNFLYFLVSSDLIDIFNLLSRNIY